VGGCLADLQPLQVEVVVAVLRRINAGPFFWRPIIILAFGWSGKIWLCAAGSAGTRTGCLLFGRRLALPGTRCVFALESRRTGGPIVPAGQQHAVLILPWIRVPQLASHALGK